MNTKQKEMYLGEMYLLLMVKIVHSLSVGFFFFYDFCSFQW